MEISTRFATGSPEKQTPLPTSFNTNRIKDQYHLAFPSKNKYQSSISSSIVHGFKGFSMNKISNHQQNAKIDIIKFKCFETSKVKIKPQKDNANELDKRKYNE